MAVLAAATAWLTMQSWNSLSEDSAEFSAPLFFLAGLVALTGFLARWRALSRWLVVAIQLVVGAGGLLAVVAGSPLPTAAAIDAFMSRWQDAVTTANEYMAPIPFTAAPIAPLVIAAGLVVVLLVDITAATLDRIPLTGLVLLIAYSVPVAITGDGFSPLLFVLSVACFIGLLYVSHTERVRRWGRDTGPDDVPPQGSEESFSVRTGAVRGSALAVGAGATALGLLVPLFVPMLTATPFEGSGPGESEIEVVDPTIDLRRDLLRGEDLPLLWVTSPRDEKPTYLRTAALTQLNGNSWSPGNRDIPVSQVADGEMPPLTGVAPNAQRTRTAYDVRVSDDFRSNWLPTAPLVSSVVAPGDWRYDRITMDFMSPDNDVTTAGIDYSYEAVVVQPDPEDMNTSTSGTGLVSPRYLELPGGVSDSVRDLATRITRGEPTRFQQAQALQSWFRDDNRFRYSLETADDADREDLDSFLDPSGRVGYCEQFAASMAIMSRVVGIPSRVAVGFLEPDRVENESAGPATWVFSSHDMHAWVELFFPGSGWVRFDPTPAARVPEVPAYTTVDLDDESRPTLTPSSTAATEAMPDRTPNDEPAALDGADDAFPLGWVLGSLAGLLMLAALALGPRLLRRRQRAHRLHGGLEDLWSEVRSHAIDLGHPWPDGRSPRATGARVAALFGAPIPTVVPGTDRGGDDVRRPRRGPDQDPEATDALERLVVAIERSRYARQGGYAGSESLAHDTERVLAALDHGVTPRARRWAQWWPRSVRSELRTGLSRARSLRSSRPASISADSATTEIAVRELEKTAGR